MKKLILSFVFITISCQQTALVKKEAKVYLDLKESSNVYTIIERYRLRGDECKIAWEVLTNKANASWGLKLRYMEETSKKSLCRNFKNQAGVHKQVLIYILNKYNTAKFSWVRTPGLRAMNPSGVWNNKIKELAANNIEWIEFTKKYPNHKSGKSSNALLAEELNQNLEIIKDFTDLFLPKFSLELSNVEKVFTKKLNNQTVFYDAGSYEFRVTK